MAKKIILTIKHKDSGNIEKLSESDYEKLQDRIKVRYDIEGRKEEADTPEEAKK